MKLFVRLIAVVFLVICYAAESKAQNTTNSGTEFWTTYMAHNSGPSLDGNGRDGGSLMSLYITSTVNTSGTVTIADNSFKSIIFDVVANQVTIVTLPAVAYVGSYGKYNKGIHIVTKKPVAIYAHIYAESVSGATLLLPVSTLDKDYFSINYKQFSNAKADSPAYSTMAIIATEDNTTVHITPTSFLLDGHGPTTPFDVQLSKGELYQGFSNNDLTGSRIGAVNSATGGCTKIAVFSGSSRVAIGCDPKLNSSDNLFQQVYPTATWGKSYVTVPLRGRNYDIFRILLSNPSTIKDPNVRVNGNPVSIYNFVNGFYQFSSREVNNITADQPIQVVQYAVSQGNTIDCEVFGVDQGDPEMIFLNPLEQTLDHVTLYATGNYRIAISYINVVIKTSAVPTFVVNGNHYSDFKPVPGNALYSYAQIIVAPGPNDVQVAKSTQGDYTLSAADGFNATVYGFGDKESYGYAAGTNLKNLNENITLANPANNLQTQANGCLGTSYNLELTLPYQTSNIKWDLKNGTTYTDNNPKLVSVITKGTQKLYLYQYYKPVTYFTAGDTSVIASVLNPVGNECGTIDQVEFDFNISPIPQAAFSSADNCLGDATQFNDKTVLTDGNYIKTWLWDFGDNTTSVLENPVHTYAQSGSYKVSLTVANENGCTTTSQNDILINHKPVAVFTSPANACAGKPFIFTDASTTMEGHLITWTWDYGDGQTETFNNASPVSHTYANTGTYIITLTVTNDNNCQGVVQHNIVANPSPEVDFSIPEICVTDVSAHFINNSAIADGTEDSFTYLWDFGDNNATAANPNSSTGKNPFHKYTRADNYNVTLSVTSKAGCVFFKTQQLTVNGDMPSASFVVENQNTLCSASDVVFDDRGSVNFGNITKVVWHFDNNNNPNDTTVFHRNEIPANHKINHNYGVFNTPASKSYAVVMDVYSGITCVNSYSQNITIKSNPLVKLLPLLPLCQNDLPVQVTADNGGFTGTGMFSGPGISPKGLFDPTKTGTGTFTIAYTFTGQNGCDYITTEDVIVKPIPLITAPASILSLEGGQVRLPAVAVGDGLTYRWSPAAGLDDPTLLNPVASPAEDITYTLTATNLQGCSSTAQVMVKVLKYLQIPNTFTPNGDGVNDTWTIKYLDQYPDNTIEIFNRYGTKIYWSTGNFSPWDGKYKGSELPTGVYYYIINPKSGRKPVSGYVTIIR